MADPFGDDVVDFKIDEFLTTSYQDAVSQLAVQRKPLGSRMPRSLGYPVITHAGAGEAFQHDGIQH